MTPRKKLIEVALPLPEINDASAYDKMPGIGPHPKGIHHWWARLPLPTARVVLFASVVDDPSSHPEKYPTEEDQDRERERLFDIIRRMMGKKLHEHPEVYVDARAEMIEGTGGEMPVVFDPFAGGGSIPLEANRLGFEAHAGDLNPVAVLLNKCNLEIAPKWAGRSPVNPEDCQRIGAAGGWRGTYGLAADVRYYGRLIRDQVRKKLGNLYPQVRLPKAHGGMEANVIAWIWARTVSSPNPAARGAHVPLVSTFWLSSKKGSEAWLEPVVEKDKRSWHFEVRIGAPKDRAAVKAGTKTGRAQFRCLLTDTPIPDHHIKTEGLAGRLGTALLAIVAEGRRGRLYLPADATHERAASVDAPTVESGDMPDNPRWFSPPLVGFKTYTSVFTPRQLTAMVALSDSVKCIGTDIRRDAEDAGLTAAEADAYARAVMTFLALAVDRCADFNNALCGWKHSGQQSMHLFGRQAIPMMWDFVEANIMGEKAVSWHTAVGICADAVETISPHPTSTASANQIDAATGAHGMERLLVSTDPPYYDNIGYAALSDFFYVWLRRTIGKLYPDLFSTVLVPKMPELTASPERFAGDKLKAKEHFESGFRRAFTALRERMDPRFPLTVYYAFKQSDEEIGGGDEEDDDESAIDLTTGWETLLEALIASHFQITATWPVRASQKWRMVSMGTNALASYIVLACRPRPDDAPRTDRRTFVAELKRELPRALHHLQQGNIAPVDFAQAAIGPGMAVYSRYREILESKGKPLSVRAALRLINQTLTEVLSKQDDEFDTDTRWAIQWFDEHGFDEGAYGDAELLSKAKNTSVKGLEDAGILVQGRGKVRLLRPDQLVKTWDPETDKRFTIWEATHHLVRLHFHDQAGDEVTATLLRRIGSRGGLARDLAYRLYNACGETRSSEAQAYNALVLGWPEIARLAQQGSTPRVQLPDFFEPAEG